MNNHKLQITKLLFLAGFIFSTLNLLAKPSEKTRPDSASRKVRQDAFVEGERLTYRVHYGWLNAGEASFEVHKKSILHNGRECYQLLGSGRSASSFDWFFRVRDYYTTYVDKQTLLPLYYIRKVEEGGYKFSDTVSFDFSTKTVKSTRKTTAIPINIQDVLSALYYARCLDFENALSGDVFKIPIFLDDEIYDLGVKVIGKEKLKLGNAVFNTIKLQPILVEGRVFKESNTMEIWVSDDENKIPLKVKSPVIVGSVEADLKNYSNLRNPFTSKVK